MLQFSTFICHVWQIMWHNTWLTYANAAHVFISLSIEWLGKHTATECVCVCVYTNCLLFINFLDDEPNAWKSETVTTMTEKVEPKLVVEKKEVCVVVEKIRCCVFMCILCSLLHNVTRGEFEASWALCSTWFGNGDNEDGNFQVTKFSNLPLSLSTRF